jgi:flagellar biosynthesis chaperone FliJ
MKRQIELIVRCRELRVQAAHAAHRRSSDEHRAALGVLEHGRGQLATQLHGQSAVECRIDAAFESGQATGMAASAVRAGHAQMRRVLGEHVAAARLRETMAAAALARRRVECAQTERSRSRAASLVEHLNAERARERERLDEAQCDDWRARSP